MIALHRALDLHHVLHLGTNGDGGAHVAALFYLRLPGEGMEGARLAWISTRDVLHSRHLLLDPRAAASISASTPAIGAIEGIQLRGQAGIAEDQAAIRAAYIARFPESAAWIESSPAHVFWVLRPSWARLIETVEGRPARTEW